MEIDTGSPVCVVPRGVYEKHSQFWPRIQKARVKLSCYLGKLPVLGEIPMKVSYREETVEAAVTVLDCEGPSLCGRDLIQKLNLQGIPVLSLSGLRESTSQQSQGLQAFLREFGDLFTPGLGLIKGPPAHLYLKEGAVPKFCKARPLPYALRNKVSTQLDRLVEAGVISPVTHSDWATPVVPVLKKDGSVRLCGDFKVTLNPACAVEKYPLPVLEDLFASLNGGQFFTTLDLRDAYNQIPLDEESRKLTVINTHRGLYCFNRLPFGVSSAPAIFQRTIERILHGIPGVQAYLDDVLLAERGHDDKVLEAVLQRFREHGVKLNKQKCCFKKTSVEYLGHRIDGEGIHPMEKNLQAIKDAPLPKNISELRSFLGMLTFYSRFLPSMTTMLAPLYHLLEKKVAWHWGHEQGEAFNRAKTALVNAKVLTHFDPTKELRLECDASSYGLGAVLFHRVHGSDRPIGFRSRTLTSAEKNYSQLEREALALVFGVKRFRDYLLGREFTLVTDHQPLVGLLRSDRPTPVMAAARIQRWSLLLGGYRYKLEYRPDKTLLTADALSRLPLYMKEDDDSQNELPEYILALEHLDEGPVSQTELQATTAADPQLSQIKNYILDGWPRSRKAVEEDLHPFYDRKLELSVAYGLIYWGHRVIVPQKARKRLLFMLHETHQGTAAMKALARSRFWWPGLDKDIERITQTCQSCIQAAPMPRTREPVDWPTTGENWSRIHLDYAGPVQGRMILVIVDSHSKWIEAIPLRHATSESTVTSLRAVFSRFGIPRTLVTDNGTPFTSKEFAEFVRRNCITHLRSAPFHPQSNGLAERAVHTIKDALKKAGGSDLDTTLARILFSYRRTPRSSGKSPSELRVPEAPSPTDHTD
ncbi:uncharacterized protein K02A2.6-like [Ornithodoros turicata]|uniref:uncharacterized protein K02A2.6-like n=1 Tax=Ornithodoros turicata TaxID=34597 RepID=UPI0031390E44